MSQQDYTFEINPMDLFEINKQVRGTIYSETVNHTLFLTSDQIVVDFGTDKNPALVKYVIDNNIKSKAYRTHGGSLIITPQEASIMIIFANNVKALEIIPFLIRQLSGFIHEIAGDEHTITTDNNDILMDGFKVSSYSYNAVGYVHLFNFGVNETVLEPFPLEKPTVKIPKGLTELTGKTKEDLMVYLDRVLVQKNFI